MKKNILTILLYFGILGAFGQIQFTAKDGPSGGGVTQIAINSSGQVFAIVSPRPDDSNSFGSVYRSTNNGSTWTKISTGTNGLNDLDALNLFIDADDNIYVLGLQHIYKSLAASGGTSWTAVQPGDPYYGGRRLTKTADGDLYLLNSTDEVLESQDDGVTWTNINNNLPVTNYGALTAIGNDVYLGVLNEGVYKITRNSSVIWSAFNTGTSLPDQPSSFAVKGTTLYQSNRNGVFYHNGTTWVQVGQENNAGDPTTYIPENFNSTSDHQIVNGDGTRVYLVFKPGHGRIYYNDNPGTDPWTLQAGVDIGDNIFSMASFTTGTFVGYGRQGIMRSTDNGATWDFADNGIGLSGNSSFVINSDRYIVANGTSALNISDYGSTWSKEFVDVACHQCGVNIVYKKTNGDLLAIGQGHTYESTNNAQSWLETGTGAPFLNRLLSSDDINFYGYQSNYPTDADFYFSNDDAVTFSTMTITGLPSPNYDVRGFTVDASNNLYIVINKNDINKLYKVDGTNVATEITNTGHPEGIDNVFEFENKIYVLGRTSSGRTIAVSADGGQTWSSTVVGGNIFDFMVLDENVFIGVGNSGNERQYYYSNDGGSEWVPAFTGRQESNLVGGFINESGYASVILTHAPLFQSDASILRPVTPTNLQSVGTGAATIVLEWDHDMKHLNSFIVQRRLQSGGDFVSLDSSVSVPYYTDKTVIANTAYVYRIIAYNEGAGSNLSDEIGVSTVTECSLTIPDNRSWTGVVDESPNPDFTKTTIGIRKVSDELYEITDVTAGSLEVVTGIANPDPFGQTAVKAFFYENCGQPFIVDADKVYANGNGTWDGTTLTLHFQIDKSQYNDTRKTITLTLNANDPPPGVPQNVTGYVYDNTTIKLQWQADFYHHKYLVHRSTTSGFTPSPATLIDEVLYPELTYLDGNSLTLGSTYYYKIIAANVDAVPELSAPSTEVSVVFKKPMFVPSETSVWGITASAPTTAWVDFNNDGFEDLLLPAVDNDPSAEPLLFQNTGSDFTLLTAKFPAGIPYISPSVGDYDNDGLIDVYMTSLEVEDGTTASKYSLFRNTGDFNFVEQNIPDISQASAEGAFTSSWVDFNNDGVLDLFVINSEAGGQELFQGDGSGGFTKITTGALATDGFSGTFGSWSDYDKNGFQDMLIVSTDGVDTNDDGNDDLFDGFRMFRNTNGTFTKLTSTAMDANDSERIFSYSWGDYNNDLNLDLFAVNQNGANLLFRNNGDGTFTKVTPAGPTDAPGPDERAFSSAWGDIDNDGDLDLVVASGFASGSKLYLNNGSGSFTKVIGELLTNAPGFHLSASFADYDKNGLLDLLVGQLILSDQGNGSNFAYPNIKLLKNNNAGGNNWAQIKLVGTMSNASAIGARIVVTTGAKSQIREISSHSAFGSQNSLIAHFGLGSATTIDNIQVTWPSGLVQNLTNQPVNAYLEITEDGTGPVATSVSPANNATNVASNTVISITLDEPATAVAGKSLLLYLHSDMATAIDGVDLADAVTSDNLTYTFTLPDKLQAATQYNISIDAGAFVDQFGNESLEFPTGLWTFTTGAGPAISALSPAHNAFGVAIDAALQITFDEPPTAIAAKNIRVFDGGTEILSLPVLSNGTVTGNVYELPAPAEGWPFNALLEVTIDAGAFTDADANDFAGIVSGNWTFTTVEAADVNPPTIVLDPALPQFVQKGFGISIQQIDVRDDKQVATVVLHVRKISDATFTQFNATPGAEPHLWNVTLSENTHFDATGAEFFITATDVAGNEARNPEGSETKTVFLNYTGNQAAIPSNRLGLGGQKSNWKVFSIPFIIPTPNNAVTAIMDEITATEKGLLNKVDYRLLTINASGSDWSEYPTFSTIERGKGYFVNIKQDPGIIGLPNNVTTPQNTRSDLFEMTLQPGWNMVGNPYLTPINWDNVATISTLTGTTATLVKFSAGTYSEGNQALEPYEGAFVNNASTTPVPITIPFLGQTESGGRKGVSSFSSDIAANEWLLKLNLHQADITYGMGAIGMSPEGSPTLDNFDAVTPPRFIDFLEINFDHPEHFQKRFTRDIVPTQNQYTWEFSVDSNLEGVAELNWDNLTLLNSGRELFLLDIAGQKLVNMKETGSYLFDPKESSNFKIYFGENLNITPERVQLGKAYPNPTSGYTKIAFSLPETGGLNQSVSLDIMDAMGRTVGTITQGRFNPGYHETSFDARELTNGFYTYRLTVQSNNGRTMEVNKLIIK